jgi:hypothetical protein
MPELLHVLKQTPEALTDGLLTTRFAMSHTHKSVIGAQRLCSCYQNHNTGSPSLLTGHSHRL